MTTEQKSLRADARRNRNAILAAARRVFAERGFDAPLDLIAHEAGVGRGTQYRHFPTRECLIEAIFDDNFEATERMVASVEDPADGYVQILLLVVDQMIENRGFLDVFDERVVAPEVQQGYGERLLAIVRPALERAQAAGRVRCDLRVEDTLVLLRMLGAVTQPPGVGYPPALVERGIALVLESIEPDPRLPLDGSDPR